MMTNAFNALCITVQFFFLILVSAENNSFTKEMAIDSKKCSYGLQKSKIISFSFQKPNKKSILYRNQITLKNTVKKKVGFLYF